MKGLFICIRKDIWLLMGNGVQALVRVLLPLLLILAMFWGMSDIANRRAYMSSFSLAIRDLDETPMSRMLIEQLKDIELFDTIYDGNKESDDVLFTEYEVVAVLTLPKDFFYSLYNMKNYTVDVKLNGNKPLEAAIVESLITSLMNIIREDQQTMWAVNTLKYGDLSKAQKRDLYKQASLTIIQDALGRQGVFEAETMARDDAQDTALFFYGSVLTMLLMFIPLCILKTFPDELRLGILPRYKAVGGSLLALIISKALAAFLICLFTWAILTFYIIPAHFIGVFTLFFICFCAAFSMFLMISVLLEEPSRSQLAGNMLLLLSMVLGGGLYPIQLLPPALQTISRATIPYYFVMGLNGITHGITARNMLTVIWPLIAAIFVFMAITSVFLTGRRHRRI